MEITYTTYSCLWTPKFTIAYTASEILTIIIIIVIKNRLILINFIYIIFLDCSDLEEKIKWCRANDEKCQKIAENAKQLYQYYVSRDGVLDYMQAIFVEISNKWVSPPLFADNPPLTRVPPVSNTGCRTINGNNRECYEGGLCGTCELRKIEEDKINKSIDNRSIGGKSKKSDDPIDEINQLKKEKRLKNIALEKAKNKARKELINSML